MSQYFKSEMEGVWLALVYTKLEGSTLVTSVCPIGVKTWQATVAETL